MKNLKQTFQKYNIPQNAIGIYGQHPCKSALLNTNRNFFLLCTTKHKIDYWKQFLSLQNINLKIALLEPSELDIITSSNNHQNIVLYVSKIFRKSLIEYLRNINQPNQKIVILDQLTDPQNVGSIIRSAFAFNFNAVCLLRNNSPTETPALIKASAGEIENINIIELGNLVQEIKLLKKNNFFVYGLDGEGLIEINKIENNNDNIALIVGAEGKGLRNLTKKNVDQILRININSQCNSLNAANAAAVAMYELSKN